MTTAIGTTAPAPAGQGLWAAGLTCLLDAFINMTLQHEHAAELHRLEEVRDLIEPRPRGIRRPRPLPA